MWMELRALDLRRSHAELAMILEKALEEPYGAESLDKTPAYDEHGERAETVRQTIGRARLRFLFAFVGGHARKRACFQWTPLEMNRASRTAPIAAKTTATTMHIASSVRLSPRMRRPTPVVTSRSVRRLRGAGAPDVYPSRSIARGDHARTGVRDRPCRAMVTVEVCLRGATTTDSVGSITSVDFGGK